MKNKRKLGHKVKPRSTKLIINSARKFKDLIYEMFEPLNQGKKLVPVVDIYDYLQDIEFLEYEVVPDSELDGQLAVTYPDKSLIRITETVFDGACDNEGFHRFTLAHELGHLILHTDEKAVMYARGETPNHKIFQDSEWQADEFASEFLMDSRKITGRETSFGVSIDHGVSLSAAKTKLGKISKKK